MNYLVFHIFSELSPYGQIIMYLKKMGQIVNTHNCNNKDNFLNTTENKCREGTIKMLLALKAQNNKN